MFGFRFQDCLRTGGFGKCDCCCVVNAPAFYSWIRSCVLIVITVQMQSASIERQSKLLYHADNNILTTKLLAFPSITQLIDYSNSASTE